MNSLSVFLSALTDHLWQSTLFAAGIAALALLFRRNSASTRYGLWLAASIKFLVPFSLLSALGARLYADVLGRFWAPDVSATDTHVAGLYAIASMVNGAAAPLSSTGSASSISDPGAAGVAPAAVDLTAILLPCLAAAWVLGSLTVVTTWLLRWTRIRRALRESKPLSIDFIAPVRASDSLLEPGVIGVFRPVLLLPAGIAQDLTPEQLQAVLAHERCHVQRRDNLTAALHMVVEAAFWFHPLVWWLGARLIEERERACDEHVLRGGHAPESYGEAILKVCQHYVQSRLSSVSTISGADLRKRMEGIMKNELSRTLSRTHKLILAAAGCVAVVVPVAVGIMMAPQVLAQGPDGDDGTHGYRSVSIQLSPPRPCCQFRGAFGSDFYKEDATLGWLVSVAYDVPEHQVIDTRPTKDTKYDIVLEGPSSRAQGAQKAALRNVLKKHFGLVVQSERRETEGYVLLKGAGSPRLKPGVGAGQVIGLSIGYNALAMTNSGLAPLTTHLSNVLRAPVADETGVTGRFDYGLVWGPPRSGPPGPDERVDPAVLIKAVEEQLGLHLESRRTSVEVLNVVSAKAPADVVTGQPAEPWVLSQAEADLLAGSWHGSVQAPHMPYTAVLRFTVNGKRELSGTLSVPGAMQDYPLTGLRFSGGTLSFREVGFSDEGFAGNVTPDAIRGTWKIFDTAVPVNLKKGEPEPPAFALSAETFAALGGTWTGKQGAFTIGLDIQTDGQGRYTGFYENRDLDVRIPLSEASLSGNRLVARTAIYKVEMLADLSGRSISGTVASMDGPPSAFTLSRQ